ncbi:MAG: YkvA family protein [Microcoleaceae cyanobacterium MO_207.B10]|nr:YkvA family protein [Microcoleaceae cyanobacterium MO_207.B10]
MSFSIQSLYTWYRNTIRNPKYRWWIILGTLAYVLSPFDISPDFIPVIGQVDDVAIVTLLVAEVSQMVIDFMKLRQGKDVASVSNINDANTADGTVDVDAVSVK